MVVVESSFINVSCGAIRKNPWPGHGETIVGHLELFQDSDILVYFMVAITGYVPIIIIENSERRMSELVPDA